ncbi:MAG: hypothetical protein Q8P67_08980, partial [archaeon]|nr:hypothetical protein [archaeon]
MLTFAASQSSQATAPLQLGEVSPILDEIEGSLGHIPTSIPPILVAQQQTEQPMIPSTFSLLFLSL